MKTATPCLSSIARPHRHHQGSANIPFSIIWGIGQLPYIGMRIPIYGDNTKRAALLLIPFATPKCAAKIIPQDAGVLGRRRALKRPDIDEKTIIKFLGGNTRAILSRRR